MYFWYNNQGQLAGVVATHVDDIIHGSGDPNFEETVMVPLKRKCEVGSEEVSEFRYVGMQIKQHGSVIKINQDHYLETLEVPADPTGEDEQQLGPEGQEEFRSLVGKIGWLVNLSRPDLSFDHVSLSCRLGHATVKDMKDAIRTMRKLKFESGEITVLDLGDMQDWVIEGYGDAGFRSMSGKVDSCGGRIVLIRNMKTEKACILSWRSKKLRRVVASSTAAETLSMTDTISEMIYVKAILKEMFKGDPRVSRIPMRVYTDSKNLWRSVHSTALVEDPRLRIDLAIVKDALATGEISEVVKVDSKQMIADVLTKKGYPANS